MELHGASVKVEGLELNGFPGMSFTGYLEIEPDESMGNTEWFVWAASPFDGELGPIYNQKNHPDLFAAICRTVERNKALVAEIWDAVRD
jgi:hypothetical protein